MTFVITTKGNNFDTEPPTTDFHVEFGGPEALAAFGGSPCSTTLYVPLGGGQVIALKDALNQYCGVNNLPLGNTVFLDGKEI